LLQRFFLFAGMTVGSLWTVRNSARAFFRTLLKIQCLLDFLQAVLDKTGRFRGEITVLEDERSDPRQDAHEHQLSHKAYRHPQALSK
jgi:hypothetical protein